MTLRCLLLLLAVVGASAQDVAQMDTVVRHYGDNKAFMGSVLVTKDGKPIFERSYGYANAEWQIPNSSTTKFRIASISKQFTSVCILLLEEQGKLSIDDRLNKYVPDPPKAWENITIRQLMNHTSGIPNYEGFEEYPLLKVRQVTSDQMLDMLKARDLDFAPGTKYSYSNSGYSLLAYLIEEISGQDYGEFLQANILDPLGLKNTGVDTPAEVLPNRASGYFYRDDQLVNAAYLEMSAFLGSGNLYSTTGDLAKWMGALYQGQILSQESLKKLMTPGLRGYALGVDARPENGRRRVGHNGSLDGFNTFMAYYPETKVAVVALANNADTGVREIGNQLSAWAHGETVWTRRGLKSVVWLSREGNRLRIPAPPDGAYESFALAPRDQRIILTEWLGGLNWDLRIWDPERPDTIRLTSDPDYEGFPVWSPDGAEIAFAEDAPRQIYRKRSSGGGEAERLTSGPGPRFVLDWSSDGKWLLYRERGAEGHWDLSALPLGDDEAPVPITRTPFEEGEGAISPDGQSVAYASDRSGRPEIYAQGFPRNEEGPAGVRQISSDGGYSVKWRADGKELFYLKLDGTMMAAEVETGPEGIRVQRSRQLFANPGLRGWTEFDVTPDGQRFAFLLSANTVD